MNIEKKTIAKNFAEYTSNPNRFSSIEGVPSEIAVRLPGFATFGMDGDVLVEAVRKAGPEKGPATPGWSKVLMDYGHAAMDKGRVATKAHDSISAEKAFLAASFWYFLARFPHILNADSAKAYQLHLDAYLHANKHCQYPLEIMQIPFNGKVVPAFLRLPKIVRNKLPIVMIWGGIDVWKGDLEIHSQGNAFLEQGIAVLALDMPGTGECPIPVSKEAHAWYLAALDFLKADSRIDASRIGCYGLSFGGYWAVKLALIAPWLAGVINNAGPVHYTFQPQWISKLPLGIKFALARVCGINPTDVELPKILSDLSILKQGLLPTSKHSPLLSINGEDDELVPIQDLYFIREQGVKQDSLIFAHDRHVASRHWRLHEQFAAHWMAHKLQSII